MQEMWPSRACVAKGRRRHFAASAPARASVALGGGHAALSTSLGGVDFTDEEDPPGDADEAAPQGAEVEWDEGVADEVSGHPHGPAGLHDGEEVAAQAAVGDGKGDVAEGGGEEDVGDGEDGGKEGLVEGELCEDGAGTEVGVEGGVEGVDGGAAEEEADAELVEGGGGEGWGVGEVGREEGGEEGEGGGGDGLCEEGRGAERG